MDPIKKRKLLDYLWEVVKSVLLSIIKDAVVNNVTRAMLATLGTSAPFVWLSAFVSKHFYNEIMEPLVKIGLVEVEYVYHKAEGKILIKRLEGASNAEEYNAAVDDIMS